MENLRIRIKEQSGLAVQLGREALEAAKQRDFVQSSKLRQQAQEAGRRCAQLIEQYTEICDSQQSTT